MIKGLMVIRESGTPVYCFLREKVTDDQEVLISGFLTAMQMFAKDMFSREGSEINSVSMSKTVFTFRTLTILDDRREPIGYHFVLMTETGKSQTEVDTLLEYLIVSFLAYENCGSRSKLRKNMCAPDEFSAFDDYVRAILNADWNAVKKKVKPVPGSLMQGLLNELRNYLPVSQIVALHPRLVRIGPSYAWLSDDLPQKEETLLQQKIRQALTRLYGPGVYESILADVEKTLHM